MQIIYVHTTDVGAPSTAINFIYYNAASLAREGIAVYLLLSNSSTEPARDILLRHFDEEIPENLHIQAFPRTKNKHVQFYKQVTRYLKKHRTPDTVLITRAIGFLPYLYLFRRIGHKMHVFFELHDTFYDIKRRTGQGKIKTNQRKKSLYEHLFFPFTQGLICLNEAYQRLYKSYLPNKTAVVFRTGLQQIVVPGAPREKQVVYIGSVDNRIYALTDVLRVAQLTDSTVKFLIVGGKSEKEVARTRELIDEMQLGQQVGLIPWVDKARLGKILGASQLGLLAIRNTFRNQHNTHLKLLDYYAHGLPVIVPPFHAYKELLINGKEGFYLDWESQHQEIASAIERVVHDEELFETMSQHVYQRAETLTWKKRAEQQIAFFEEFLGAGR